MLEGRLVDADALDPVFFHLARLTREGFLSPGEAEALLARGERVQISGFVGLLLIVATMVAAQKAIETTYAKLGKAV